MKSIKEIADEIDADDLNGDLYKERFAYYQLGIRKMIRELIKATPRDVLIKILKEQKIIKQDWDEKGNVYVEK